MLQDIVNNLSFDNYRITNSVRRPALVTDGIRVFHYFHQKSSRITS